jgi:T5SS/PEP-CTERM-associated repeat protein
MSAAESQVSLTGLLNAARFAGTTGIVNVDGSGSQVTSNGAFIGQSGIGFPHLTGGGNYDYGAGTLL